MMKSGAKKNGNQVKPRRAGLVGWSRLNLKTLPALKEEISFVKTLYEKCPSEELYQDISLRIDELERFYLENETDKRAVLVERLRLDLQSALQISSDALHGDDQDEQELQKQRIEHVVEEETKDETVRERKKKKKQQPIYGWEKTKKVLQPPDENSDMSANNNTTSPNVEHKREGDDSSSIKNYMDLEPANAADLVASMSYAAAHSGEMAFLSPFGKQFNFTKQELEEDAGLNESTSTEHDEEEGDDANESNVIAKFAVSLTEAEYFEIMRRREIYLAKQKAVRLEQQKQQTKQEQRSVEYFRIADPYFDQPRKEQITQRLENRSNWVSDKDFYVSLSRSLNLI